MTTEERIANFTELCNKANFNLSDNFLNWLINNGFFTAPASTKYHGAYEGGLYDHSYGVMKRLVELSMSNKLRWQRKESPFIVGMFHDLCKIDQYKKVEGTMTDIPGLTLNAGYHYEYNTNTIIKGHGTKSIIYLSQFVTLTEEEMLCIRFHMGAYGNESEQKEEWSSFDKAIRQYETVLWTHQADQLASKVDDV